MLLHPPCWGSVGARIVVCSKQKEPKRGNLFERLETNFKFSKVINSKLRFQKQESKEAYEPSAVIATQEPEPPLVPLEGTRPSIVAASVASQWRQDSVKKEYKKQPLTEKPSVISFSDDSLLNEDTGHTYNLSEQSHEVLQQVVKFNGVQKTVSLNKINK